MMAFIQSRNLEIY